MYEMLLKFEFVKHVGVDPASVPWERDDTIRSGLAIALVEKAGFSPASEYTAIGQLTADWNGHAKGAVVVVGKDRERRWVVAVEK